MRSKRWITSRRLIAWWFVAVALAWGRVAPAAPTLSDSFENETLRWQVAGGNLPVRVTRLQQNASAAHFGSNGVDVELTAGHGTHVDLTYDLGKAPVIRELAGHVWIRGNRPGVQLFARVLLPRTIDTDSQQPVEVLIQGDRYENVGRWQHLTVEDFPRLVKRHARKLRAKLALPMDERGAYVDRLVLRLRPERGVMSLAIDDLTVEGHVEPRQEQTDLANQAKTKTLSQNASSTPAASSSRSAGISSRGVGIGSPINQLVKPAQYASSASMAASDAAVPGARAPRVQMQGSILLVDGRPWLPRIVEYSGETFEELRQLGFNGVALRELATGEQLAAAREAGLWIVCPPPSPEQMEAGSLPRDYDMVLAWRIGEKLSQRELSKVQHWVGTLRRHDPWSGRPLVGQVVSEQRAYGRLLDIFVVKCPRQHLMMPAECLDWLMREQSLARPGTVHWIVVPTQLPASLREQADLVAKARGQRVHLPELEVGQITRAAFLGLASGSQGLLYTSDVPFVTNGVTMNRRMAEIELVNNTIGPLESLWAEAEPPRGTSVQNGNSVFTLRRAPRGQILVRCVHPPTPDLSGESFPYPLQTRNDASNSLVVPGVPEAASAYRWSTDGLELLARRRAAGGIRVRMERPRENDILLFTHDEQLTTYLHRRVAAISRRSRNLDETLDSARSTRRVPETHYRFSYDAAIQRLAQSGTAVQLLASGGAFDRLATSRSAGWRHLQSPIEGVVTGVEIDRDNRREGSGCLHLFAASADGRIIDHPPVWIAAPPVPLSAGDLVRVSGYCRIETVSSRHGGLQITDSIGGPSLALQMKTTSGWRRFSFYRIAPRIEMMQVTFAVTGVGDVWLDDIRIERMVVPPPEIATANKEPLFAPPSAAR